MMIIRRMRAFSALVAALALAAGLVAGVAAATAQDTATPEAGDEELPHLAHIKLGACEEQSHIVFKLDDVGEDSDDSATPAAVASPGDADTSTTIVNVSLDELLADPHLINIHLSIEAVDTHIACGEITGTVSDGKLHLEIGQLNSSGFSGTATLTDNGDGTTTVVITVTHGAPSPAGTPEATPVS